MYAMETLSASSKRKPPPNTPTKLPTPPTKVKISQSADSASAAVTEAINKLSSKMNDFGTQLRDNAIMVANISKLVEMNAEQI